MNPTAPARDLLDLFLPRGCIACASRIPPEDGSTLVCARCRTLLRSPPSPRCPRCDLPMGTGTLDESPCLECREWPEILVSARSAVVLEPPADAMVHALKYGGWWGLGELMGRRMAACRVGPAEGSVVVPVATTPRRRRVRGYNQAQILAEVVAKELGLRWLNALERPGGRSQVRAGPGERRRNVANSFRTHRNYCSRIRDQEVILVDDVLTTGATAVAAARALGEAGAGRIRLLTFARAMPFGSDTRNGRAS